MYNDQPPNKTATLKYGHSKGVIMADETRGFWLVHSVPNYPPVPNTGVEKKSKVSNTEAEGVEYASSGEYSYPSSGKIYGQSFLCISVQGDQMKDIAPQLTYNQVISYRYNVPDTLPEYSIFVNVSRRMRIKNPPYNRKQEIRSIGGQRFISFAKTDKWQKGTLRLWN